MSATANVILDMRRMKNKTAKYPLKLRVCFKRVTKRYQTIFELSDHDFNKLDAPRIGADLKSVKDKIKNLEKAVINFIEEIDGFSFIEFQREFIAHHGFFKQRNFKEKGEEMPSILPSEFDFSPYEKKFAILERIIPNMVVSQPFF